MSKRKRLSLEQKKSLFGVLFISQWLLGFGLLMIVPLINSIRFSFSKLSIVQDGYTLTFVGLENFRTSFFVDPEYIRHLTKSVGDMLLNVPLVVFFSLFTATLLVQKFRGRLLARTIIFLPVILASGIVAKLDSANFLAGIIDGAAQDQGGNFSGFQGFEIVPFLFDAGLNSKVVFYLVDAVNRIYQIVTLSGVQILIFLAGIQSIPSSLYEASKMEGATGYEAFWKITFPMISPYILANTIYSIVDSFYNNKVTEYVKAQAFTSMEFGVSSAMSWIYFLVISLIIAIAAYFISKKVFYYD